MELMDADGEVLHGAGAGACAGFGPAAVRFDVVDDAGTKLGSVIACRSVHGMATPARH